MKNYTISFWITMFLFCGNFVNAQKYSLSSPDGHLQVNITNGPEFHFSVLRDGKEVIPEVMVNMELEEQRILGQNSKVRKTQKSAFKGNISPVVAIKNSIIKDEYNGLTLQFRERFNLAFRTYNDAIAYRFETSYPDSIVVKNEKCDISLPDNSYAWFGYNDRWMNGYEHLIIKQPIDSLSSAKTTYLPLLLDLQQAGKVLITESDLYDYPGLYFTGNNNHTLQSIFPPRVKTEQINKRGSGSWDRTFRPATVYDYIAKTSGTRNFPWRIFALAQHDYELLNNEVVYKLASPDKLENNNWIKPGLVAWDWWNHWNITGVDFRAGVNTQTYKYYIDFAAQNNIPFIMLDEGWYELGDLLKLKPEVDVKEIVDYGKQKGVGVFLWCVWRTLDNQMQEAMKQFQDWGVRGIKVDFMDRDDQDVVNFYYRCAKAAAAHQLMVDFHGAHKPAGIQRTYPNVVNFEGVLGLEQDKWTDKLATPLMATIIPYTRMFAGPMDYTPGAMRNAQQKDFRPINDNPMSLGTRCQQLAMYVLFDAPLQMLADNPTAYDKNRECLDFIAGVPTTWDETIPLGGEIGKYVLMGRKKGENYFVGAITNWDARDISINFSFLPEGNYHITIFQDGINADRNGIDYKKIERVINKNDVISVHLAPGGGWAAKIYK